LFTSQHQLRASTSRLCFQRTASRPPSMNKLLSLSLPVLPTMQKRENLRSPTEKLRHLTEPIKRLSMHPRLPRHRQLTRKQQQQEAAQQVKAQSRGPKHPSGCPRARRRPVLSQLPHKPLHAAQLRLPGPALLPASPLVCKECCPISYRDWMEICVGVACGVCLCLAWGRAGCRDHGLSCTHGNVRSTVRFTSCPRSSHSKPSCVSSTPHADPLLFPVYLVFLVSLFSSSTPWWFV